MIFFTDFQTAQDLNLLDRYSNKSVYAIYKSLKTSGGLRLLTAMFNNPLIDHKAINSRSSVFKYFEGIDVQLDIDLRAFSLTEEYLSAGKNGVIANTANNLRVITLKAVGVFEEYTLKVQQIKCTMKFCMQLNELLVRINASVGDNPLAKELQDAQHFLEDKIHPNNFQTEELSLGEVFKYDRLFRVELYGKLLQLVALVHQLDLYFTVASIALKNGFKYATALPSDENVLSITNCRNPLVKFAKGNSVEIDAEANIFFLTGANMAGKSTLMKSIGIAVYLAHMGFPVAADEMVFSVKDGMYTSINVSDNLEQGYSHYYAEVKRVKEVAEAISTSKKLIVIFDELFKGTNVKDAFDATLAVTEAFSHCKNCGFVISTHIIEVAEKLKHIQERIQFFYLPTIINGKIPTYTFKLSPGVSDDRHGMILIENEGVLELLK